MKFARTLAHTHQAMSSPVDLHTVASFEGQFQEGLVTHRPHRGNELVKDGSAAGVTVLGTQALEDLHAGVGIFFQPGDDQILVGIEFTGAPGSFVTRFIPSFVQPFADGLDVQPCLGANLTGSQIQFPLETTHFMVSFEVDHSATSPFFCSRLSTMALSERPLPAGSD
jgi:hypothetical protein